MSEAEIREQDAEIARLREERDTWESRYRSSVETYQDIRDENARLRAELVESRRRSMDSGKEVTRLRAELDSVQAVAEDNRLRANKAERILQRVEETLEDMQGKRDAETVILWISTALGK